jgi:hypothetical protein
MVDMPLVSQKNVVQCDGAVTGPLLQHIIHPFNNQAFFNLGYILVDREFLTLDESISEMQGAMAATWPS